MVQLADVQKQATGQGDDTVIKSLADSELDLASATIHRHA